MRFEYEALHGLRSSGSQIVTCDQVVRDEMVPLFPDLSSGVRRLLGGSAGAGPMADALAQVLLLLLYSWYRSEKILEPTRVYELHIRARLRTTRWCGIAQACPWRGVCAPERYLNPISWVNPEPRILGKP